MAVLDGPQVPRGVKTWMLSILDCGHASYFTCSPSRPCHKQCRRQIQSGPSWWHTVCPWTAGTPASCPSPWTRWPERSCSSRCLPCLPQWPGRAVLPDSHVAKTWGIQVNNFEGKDQYSRHDFRLSKKVLSSNRWIFDQLLHSHFLPPMIG